MSGLGLNGYIGFARESSGGTAVAPTQFVRARTENFAQNFEFIDLYNIAGQLDAPDQMQGSSIVQGTIDLAADCVETGHLLRSALDTSSVTTVGSSLWLHAFQRPTSSSWDARFPLQPYTFEIFRDVTSAQRYAGSQMQGLSFSTAHNQELQVSANMIGLSQEHAASTTPTFTTSPSLPFGFDACSVSIAGAAYADATAFGVQISNPMEAVGTLRNTRDVYKFKRTDFFTPTFTMDLDFENITEMQNFSNQTEQAITISFFRAGSFSLVFDIPRAQYRAFPTGMGGRGRQSVSITGQCLYHTGSLSSLEARLTTTNSYFG